MSVNCEKNKCPAHYPQAQDEGLKLSPQSKIQRYCISINLKKAITDDLRSTMQNQSTMW